MLLLCLSAGPRFARDYGQIGTSISAAGVLRDVERRDWTAETLKKRGAPVKRALLFGRWLELSPFESNLRCPGEFPHSPEMAVQSRPGAPFPHVKLARRDSVPGSPSDARAARRYKARSRDSFVPV